MQIEVRNRIKYKKRYEEEVEKLRQLVKELFENKKINRVMIIIE